MKLQVLVILLALSLSGCASIGSGQSSGRDQIAVERVDSGIVKIGRVTVTSYDSGVNVQGEVVRKRPGRGRIQGHLHIDVFGEQRELVESRVSHYVRSSVHVPRAVFKEQFSLDRVRVRSIRVIRHAEPHAHS